MRRRMVMAAIVAAAATLVYASALRATPGSGFSGATLARGTFPDMNLKHKVRQYDWEAQLETEGSSDLYVQSNTWVPGGTTGWHTHPGFSLVTVTEGTITAYDGDDPSCTPTTYTAGQSFIDPVNGHTHLIRNEGSVTARAIAVQLIPTAAGPSGRRIDVPDPGYCSF